MAAKTINEEVSQIRKMMGLNEGVPDDELDIYEVTCRDIEGQLKELIEYIAENGNGGHSFSIVVDPGDENEKNIKLKRTLMQINNHSGQLWVRSLATK